MAINFPDNPSVNDLFTSQGKSFKWTGTHWQAQVGTNAATTDYVDNAVSTVDISDLSPDSLVLPTGTSDPANTTVGATYYNTVDESLRIRGNAEWFSIKIGGKGTQNNPASSGSELSDEPTGTYYIDRGEGQGSFQAHVNNDLHGGGWVLVWNLDSRGSVNVDYRGYYQTDFWTSAAGLEGNIGNPLQSWYKGDSFSKYGSVSEIMIVAHDKGTGDYNNVDGTGGNFGDTYIIKSINAANSGRSMHGMLNAGNNNTISTSTVSRSGTVGGNGYSRTSGDIFIDMNYEMIANVSLSEHVGGGDVGYVRLGTHSRDCGDLNCNGHVILGGYGGYHNRNGAYPLEWTAQPQIGYHPAPYGYGTSYRNPNGGQTVWNNNTYPSDGIQYVDFAIYVR